MSENRRVELIESFISTFCKYGLDGTTTKKLAEGAGMSEAGLYVHFKNKEEILTSCVEEHLNRVAADTRRMMMNCDGNARNFINAMFEYGKGLLYENRFIFQVMSHPTYSDIIKSRRSALLNGYKMQAASVNKIGIPEADGIPLMLLLNSALNNYILTQDEESFHIQADYLLGLFNL